MNKTNKIKDYKTSTSCFFNKTALYLVFTFYSCVFFNIHAQQTISICKGNSVDLVPPNAGTIVEWKDQAGNTLTRLDEKGIRITDLTPKVMPLATTTYKVRQVEAVNLVANGNFDPPPTNPYPSSLSDYQYIPVPRNFEPDYARGFFTIQDNPQDLFDSTKYSPTAPDPGWRLNWYRSIGDHTTGHGNMFVANGSTTGGVVYKTTVNVTAGTTYYFGAWFANINVNFTNPYNMDIYVKGMKIGSLSGAYNDNWYQKYAFWTATATESVRLEFKNTQLGNDGNDFAIDDIVFSPVVEETVTVVVKNSTTSTTTASLCSGNNYVFNGKTYNTAGTYKDTLVNATGCDSIITLELKVGLPSVAPAINQSICQGDSVAFYGTTYKTAGTYYANLINVAGCDSLATLVLNVNPSIIAKISGKTFICKDSITPNIVFNGEGGTAPYTFTYQINRGIDKFVTTTNGDTVSVQVPTNTSGTFTYKLISVVDTKGCVYAQNDSLVLRIEVCKTVIDIPNAFTPNGDGFNDTFGPITEGVTEIKMDINDKNGRHIFIIDSINGRWDGLMPTGEQAPVGVYFYKYTAKSIDERSYTNQGSVSLFREMIDYTPIAITPNHVKRNAVIDLSRMKGLKSISIYDTFGRMIDGWVTSEDVYKFESSQLKSGLYILKVSFNNQVECVKFIKE